MAARSRRFDREGAGEDHVVAAWGRILVLPFLGFAGADLGHRDAEVACEPLKVALAEDPVVPSESRTRGRDRW